MLTQTSSPTLSQYCEGTVFGLSGKYNLAKGTGFLAVRAGPSAGSRMVGQLFTGNTVEIFSRKGNWYRAAMGGIDGRANSKWMRNSYGY
ncbi:SH3 domain-containing protein [Mesorhizobium sp. CN2-181]|uniref:SH3 domain-containing protein n=1 Tax=Mesorhizobium yinganensis TaxID=3157707 RepID=UPI0032B838C1